MFEKDDFIDLQDIIADRSMPAIVRQIARDVAEKAHANTGKILNEMSISDMISLQGEWQICLDAAREGVNFMDQTWFNSLFLISMILRQAEDTFPSEEPLNPGFDVNLLMTFVMIMICARKGIITCKDVRKLTLSTDFLKQDYRSLFEANRSTATTLLNDIFKGWDSLKMLEIEGKAPPGLKIITQPGSRSENMTAEDVLEKYLSDRRQKAQPVEPNLQAQFQDKRVTRGLIGESFKPEPGSKGIDSLKDRLNGLLGD